MASRVKTKGTSPPKENYGISDEMAFDLKRFLEKLAVRYNLDIETNEDYRNYLISIGDPRVADYMKEKEVKQNERLQKN